MSGSVGDISAGGGGIDLSRLIAAISPILLGTGKTTGGSNGQTSSNNDQTGTQTQNNSGSQSQVTTTQKNADPGTLAALLGIAQNATDRAQNPDITNQIVQNIFKQGAESFAPTVGAAASTGLYNTSTLGLLSDDARARATAQAASAVLNFQTSQQQVATNALSSILSATGSTTTAGETKTSSVNNTVSDQRTQNFGTTANNNYTVTAPSLSGGGLLQGLGGIAASVLGKKAFDVASPFFQAHLVDPVKDALGIGEPATSTIMANAGKVDPGFFADASGATSQGAETAVASTTEPAVKLADNFVDISNSPGANFTTSAASSGLSKADLASANGLDPGISPDNISIAGGADLGGSSLPIAGTAESLAAPTVDITSAVAPDISTSVAGAMTPDISAAQELLGNSSGEAVAGIGSSLSGEFSTLAGLEGAADAVTPGLEGAASGFSSGLADLSQGGAGLVNDVSGFIDGAGNFISDAVSGLGTGIGDVLSNVGDSIGNFASDAFSGIGDTLAGGVASLGLGEAFNAAFGPEVGQDLSLGTSAASFISGQLGGPTIGSIAGDIGGAALDAVGLGAGAAGAVSGAALTAAGGFTTLAALEGAADVAVVGSLGAEAAVGTAAAVAGGGSLAETLAIIGGILAWIICTELKVQGKMSEKLYRYGYKKYLSYPEWGRYGYLLWARPTVRHMRKYPDGLVTRFMSWVFNLRINNIAAEAGCKTAKWTYRGAVVSFCVELISCVLGLVIIPLRATLMAKKDWSV